MNWKSLENRGRVDRHVTNKSELDELRAVIARNLQDAAIDKLSNDNRFSIAYQAALLSAKMAIACAGYRVKGHGAHQATFQALKLAMGPSVKTIADYFDRCRRKRNELAYDVEGVVSSNDARRLLRSAERFHRSVEVWIAKHHPNLT
ncbi:MAG TPA: SAV_6107 family HEPN domain-containing protein [Pirellulales bacterium]|jgi:uncharacterized protein (UPF0332 family)|nr:SAV_6107 family HEPN domain-containing protein [Pirellulales bacterium]